MYKGYTYIYLYWKQKWNYFIKKNFFTYVFTKARHLSDKKYTNKYALKQYSKVWQNVKYIFIRTDQLTSGIFLQT